MTLYSLLIHPTTVHFHSQSSVEQLQLTSSTAARSGAESVQAKGKLQHITQSTEKGHGSRPPLLRAPRKIIGDLHHPRHPKTLLGTSS